MGTWELNPILVREVRARWRKWPAFATVAGYALLLALVVGWRYHDAVATTNYYTTKTSAALGHEIFLTLTFAQVLGWMLLAPVIGASGFLHEREMGLLEGLLLTRLSANKIVQGKMLSLLAFIVLMLLAPLPIIAVCFMLGGVPPVEFVFSTALIFMTALACGASGIQASAWHNGRVHGLFHAYLAVLKWGVLLPIPLCGLSSPVVAALVLIESQQNDGLGYAAVSIMFMAVVTAVMCGNAANGLRRPLAQQISKHPVAAPPSFILDLPVMVKRVALPGVSWLRFSNPVLQRDIKRRLRVRRAGIHASYFPEQSLALDILVVYLVVAMPVYLIASRDLFWCLAYVWVMLLIVLGALFGAEAFAHEREQDTWAPLVLTPLPLGRIIAGKLGAALFVCLYYSLPLLLTIVVYGLDLHFFHSSATRVLLSQTLATIIVGAATLWCCVTFGLLLSWLCRRVWIAVSWTLTCMFLVLVLLPMLGGPSFAMTWGNLHPLMALASIQHGSQWYYVLHGSPSYFWRGVAVYGVSCFTLGTLFLAALYARLRWARLV